MQFSQNAAPMQRIELRKPDWGTVGDASIGDFECVPARQASRSGRRTRWTLSGRDDVEALIDRRKHLIEARNHNDLDKTVLAPLSDSSGLQRVRDRLPRQCLRHDVAQQFIGVRQTRIRALGDAVDEGPRQSGVQFVLDMIVPLEGGAGRLCDAEHDELIDDARKHAFEFEIEAEGLDPLGQRRMVEQDEEGTAEGFCLGSALGGEPIV